MGTRCLTVFKDNNKALTVLYRQYDGYPDGHGTELANFLSGKELVNGLGSGVKTVFNGMGCLAASTIAFFKKYAGGFYIYPPDERDAGADYLYTIKNVNNKIIMGVYDTYVNSTIIECDVNNFKEALKKYEKSIEE